MSATSSPPIDGRVDSVAVVLVSHDGARWLPTVIEGLQAQSAAIDEVVCVDTGSRDESPVLLREAFGDVLALPGTAGFPEAVAEGLTRVAADVEWIWLLHDDATPDPGALAALLAAARERPAVDLLGPKLREWPSLRRLLELGVTISGTGRRETGLERGEYDQGQHDEVREVLAVNTAGLLVRRDVLERLGGLDPAFPVFGGDLDLGWRAAAAGHTTIVVPQAVVFHAEAAHRGVRRTPLTGRHPHFQERRAALLVLLANRQGPWWPLHVLRLTLGTLLRVLGFLAVRAVGEALDELAALASVLGSPGELREARRRRRESAVVRQQDLRGLLAPWWLPYRHGLDLVGDVVAAATRQASDVAERRRAAAAERDPASFAARRTPTGAVDDELPEDTGAVARFLTNPIAVGLALVVLLSVAGARAAFGSVVGGGLAPTPDGAGAWWGLYLESFHALGSGTSVPAPGYLLPLALLASALGGSAGLAVSVVMIAAVPVGLWGAWRLLRVVGRLISPTGMPRWLLLGGATTWALVPVVSGAWGDGRLGPVASAALLPWLAHAALGFAEPEADRRWRAAFRAGLLLTVVTTLTPTLWLVAAVLGALVTLIGLRIVPSARADRSAWGPPATALLLPGVLLLPWWLPALAHRALGQLLLDPGRLPAPRPDAPWGPLLGRLADTGAPGWLGVVLLVLAVAALLPRATRIPVLVCWIAAAVAVVVALALAAVPLHLGAVVVGPSLSGPVLVLQGALVVAAVLGAQAAVPLLLDGTPWRRGVAVALAGAAALVPIVGLAWFVAGPDDRVDQAIDDPIPAYMQQSARLGDARGVLVLTGSQADGLRYVVRRGDGDTLGEDEITAHARPDADLTGAIESLVSRPSSGAVGVLASRGIEYVVLARPADGEVAAVLDATDGLVQASAEDPRTRAWQVDRPLGDPFGGHGMSLRPVLLVVQLVALLVVAVLCGPTRRAAAAPVDGEPDDAPELTRRGRRRR
ncbi:glycosyltransferase family 2 protein [Nocardioides sp. TRM66260-LWL]|uniref:glycosyltransferase family 2 protein n=1 Tax=Nocardioides sp. TRM66260-LWL TaxID=2874478 RepID=UPI001CC36FF6|nr:glycosyltransferase family 2 protein [Nocardioides sp. TRM66260-LWL]MBZ5734213.1 glycosyltransferase family 2 protein [Nocardioides sp. TRM66260-LWL]